MSTEKRKAPPFKEASRWLSERAAVIFPALLPEAPVRADGKTLRFDTFEIDLKRPKPGSIRDVTTGEFGDGVWAVEKATGLTWPASFYRAAEAFAA